MTRKHGDPVTRGEQLCYRSVFSQVLPIEVLSLVKSAELVEGRLSVR